MLTTCYVNSYKWDTSKLFPTETKAYICDFHREQSWSRWVSKGTNEVTSCKEEVLAYLRLCAHASNRQEFEEAVHKFQNSEVWRKNARLQSWMSKTWLPSSKVI